ncbi:hypothetical protein KFU94_16180 [Chloroflexi bacterium TSY]|nr:hypothetical protein [Chloroflexi bacterium TSY]
MPIRKFSYQILTLILVLIVLLVYSSSAWAMPIEQIKRPSGDIEERDTQTENETVDFVVHQDTDETFRLHIPRGYDATLISNRASEYRYGFTNQADADEFELLIRFAPTHSMFAEETELIVDSIDDEEWLGLIDLVLEMVAAESEIVVQERNDWQRTLYLEAKQLSEEDEEKGSYAWFWFEEVNGIVALLRATSRLSRSKFGVFGDFQSRLQGFWSHLFRFRLQKTTYFISENRPNLTQKLDIDRQICIYVNCLARILSQNLKFGSTET